MRIEIKLSVQSNNDTLNHFPIILEVGGYKTVIQDSDFVDFNFVSPSLSDIPMIFTDCAGRVKVKRMTVNPTRNLVILNTNSMYCE